MKRIKGDERESERKEAKACIATQADVIKRELMCSCTAVLLQGSSRESVGCVIHWIIASAAAAVAVCMPSASAAGEVCER